MATVAAEKTVRRALRRRAFVQGFAVGADDLSGRKRHTLDQDTELAQDWRRGFEAGRRALAEAKACFEAVL